jgi:GNAT superfamily N-acetyltransferase
VIEIRQAAPGESGAVAAILYEVAAWLESAGTPMWVGDELTVERIEHDVHSGAVYVAVLDETLVGTIRFQLDDREFWPDLPDEHQSAFVHRLAVKRAYAKRGVSRALLAWSAEHARALGRRYLRLDCDAERQPLRRLYEEFGFRYHSSRQVGPHFVARYELLLTPS